MSANSIGSITFSFCFSFSKGWIAGGKGVLDYPGTGQGRAGQGRGTCNRCTAPATPALLLSLLPGSPKEKERKGREVAWIAARAGRREIAS
jgi:hypothetical protein